jgi:HEAT repeat protein
LDVLTDFPEDTDWQRVRDLAEDPDEHVRIAAVRVLCGAASDPEDIIRSLLDSSERSVRVAALSCLGEEGTRMERAGAVPPEYFERLMSEAQRDGVEARVELALALMALGDDPRVQYALGPLLRDPEPEVAGAALRTAGRLGRREYFPNLISALGSAATREVAREALVSQGEQVEGRRASRSRGRSPTTWRMRRSSLRFAAISRRYWPAYQSRPLSMTCSASWRSAPPTGCYATGR